tara:strand:+ start:4130 stop:6442 length:2313 start_codon:yes stop_codon:yes gene_type:complete
MAYGDKYYLYIDDVFDTIPDTVVTTYDMADDDASDWTGETSFSTTSLQIVQTAVVPPFTTNTATRSAFNAPVGRNRLKAVLGSLSGFNPFTADIYVKKVSNDSILATCTFNQGDADGTIVSSAFDLTAITSVYIQFDAENKFETTGVDTNTYDIESIIIDNNPEDHKFRVTIQKDLYAGATTDITCVGDNPVVITWQGDENVYKPLLGSECVLNMYDMTGSQLDEFYSAGEKEYIVLVEYYDGGAYNTYWKGYIVPDRYIQYVTSPPYVVSLRAVDELYLLDNYNFSLATETALTTVYDIIENCLDNTLLGGDFLAGTAINANFSTGRTLNFFTQCSINTLTYYNTDGTPKNCKEILESILYDGKFKISQRFGRWWVDGVGASKFYDGADALTTLDVSKTVPVDYVPIYDDLTKRIDKGLIETKKIQNLQQARPTFANPNFETSGSFAPWTDTLTLLTIDSALHYSGDQSVYYDTASIENGGSSTQVITANESVDTFAYNELITFKFAYYIDETTAGEYKVRYKVKLIDGSNPDLYWDTSTNDWTGSDTTIEVSTSVTQQWQTISLPNLNTGAYDGRNLWVQMLRCNAPSAIDVKLNIDDFLCYRGDSTFPFTLPTDKYALLTTTFTGNFTGKIDAVEVLQTDLDGFPGKYYMKDVGDTELLVTLGTVVVVPNDSFELSKFTELIRIGDFEGGNKRYEGTFYNATIPWIPFTPIDRFRINFTAQSETLTSHIDHMAFNLKQNTYEVRTHTEGGAEAAATQVLTLSANKPS